MKTKAILTTLFLLVAGVQVSRAQYGMQVWHDGKYEVYFVNDGSTSKQEGERKAIDVSFQADEGTSGFSGEDCGKLVDGTVSTKWCFIGGEGNPSYAIFHATYPIFVTGYEITTADDNYTYPGRNPKSWTFYGSTEASNPGANGASWEVIASEDSDTKLEDVNNRTYTYTLPGETDKAYQYFKWVITERGGGSSGVIQVSEFKPTYTEALIRNHTTPHIYIDSIKYISLVSKIELSQKAVELVRNTTCQLTALVLPDNADERSVVWASNRTDVATVDENGLVTAAGLGNAVITATATDGSDVQAACEVTVVRDPDSYGTSDNHEWVDLGLSSGTLWATCNVGASRPEEYGDYFAWGETEPKEYYDWSTYKWMNEGQSNEFEINKYVEADGNTNACWYKDDVFIGDGKTELEPEDDAATINWSGNWQMPTKEQRDELFSECVWTWTTQEGISGSLFTSKRNGNSIFLPAAGYLHGSSVISAGGLSYYWCRDRSILIHGNNGAFALNFYSGGVNTDGQGYRWCGHAIRPVRVR